MNCRNCQLVDGKCVDLACSVGDHTLEKPSAARRELGGRKPTVYRG